MNALNCLFERVANIGVGAVLLIIGLGFVVVTATILPPFGLLVALPVMAGALVFFFARRSKECSL
jgi:hypothetical protein